MHFRGRKFWQIWQILPNLPKFSCPIKKIDFEKLSYREYLPIYYLLIAYLPKFSPSKILSHMV